ncbi:MAG: histidine kinase [Bacillota bacterium]|nr:histidine kinase [Bacillota bacterium]MDW7677562.1 histidine kinase [Bacillota bacterium]
MPREYVLYYLIYGFAFVAMGMAAFQHAVDERISNLHLAGTLPDLGFFGVIHGISEWMTMVLATGLYPELIPSVILVRSFLKAISFAFLLRFGMRLYWRNLEKDSTLFLLPWLMLLLWAAGYLALFLPAGVQGSDSFAALNTFLMRYGMGIPGGILTFLAFKRDAALFQRSGRPRLAHDTMRLAVVFLVYGLLDGLVVRGAGFFPANIINHTAFRSLTGVPVQMLKAVTGMLIFWLLARLMQAYKDESHEKLLQMLLHQAAYDERRRIGMTLHDGIIQKLYASGLKVEYLVKKHPDEEQHQMLKEVRDGLNDSIQMVREMLNREIREPINPENLGFRLQQLVSEYNGMSNLEVLLENRIPPLQFVKMTPDQATHVFYIVQEALCNTQRHAGARKAKVILQVRLEGMAIQILDDGIGIPNKGAVESVGKGLELMNQRAEEAGGSLQITSGKKGTAITLVVPWKE